MIFTVVYYGAWIAFDLWLIKKITGVNVVKEAKKEAIKAKDWVIRKSREALGLEKPEISRKQFTKKVQPVVDFLWKEDYYDAMDQSQKAAVSQLATAFKVLPKEY